MMILILSSLAIVLAHVWLASFAIGRVYPRLKRPVPKYLFSRGALLVAMGSIPYPLYRLARGSFSLSEPAWLAYAFLVGLALCGVFIGAALRLRAASSAAQRLFWGAPARRLVAELRSSPPARDWKTLSLGPLGSAIYKPVVREIVLPIKGLPQRFSGLRVLHVTDTHMGLRCSPDFFAAVADDLERLGPDLVVHTGDLISLKSRVEPASLWLGRLARGARLGAYCVLGNHDLSIAPRELGEALRKQDCRRLSNRARHFRHKGLGIGIVGSEAPWRPADETRLVTQAMGKGRTSLWLGLAHGPESGVELARCGVDVVFCGHTHGGQVRLGRLGPPVVTARHGNRYPHGLYAVGKGLVLVSAGLGSYVPPGRLGCPPEAILAVLCRG